MHMLLRTTPLFVVWAAWTMTASLAADTKQTQQKFLAKAQPGKIIFGSNAPGSGNHLMGARFIRAAGIKVISVAFKGSPEAIIEVLAGRTHFLYLRHFQNRFPHPNPSPGGRRAFTLPRGEGLG